MKRYEDAETVIQKYYSKDNICLPTRLGLDFILRGIQATYIHATQLVLM